MPRATAWHACVMGAAALPELVELSSNIPQAAGWCAASWQKETHRKHIFFPADTIIAVEVEVPEKPNCMHAKAMQHGVCILLKEMMPRAPDLLRTRGAGRRRRRRRARQALPVVLRLARALRAGRAGAAVPGLVQRERRGRRAADAAALVVRSEHACA